MTTVDELMSSDVAMETEVSSSEVLDEPSTPPPAEDDPVVHELDVYITHSLGKLMLLQYPLRPTYKPYQNTARKQCRIRPVQQELELHMVLEENDTGPAKTQKLVVAHDPMISPNCAIGMLRGRELHLTHIKSFLQMQPSFEHVDAKVAEMEQMNLKSESEEKKDAVQSVARKFAKVETDREKAARLSSYNNVQLEKTRETWVPCDYRPSSHPYSAGQRRALYCQKDKQGVSGCEMTRTEYLSALIPDEGFEEYKSHSIIGLHDIKKLSINKQIEKLLVNAKVLSYSEVCTLLEIEPSREVLSVLQDIAVLIQGHWVISSMILYPKGSHSPITGTPSEVLCRARDFILWCFSEQPTVKRENLTNIIRIPAEEVQDILKQVSTLEAYVGWSFKYSNNGCFDEEYPEVMLSQKKAWAKLYDELYVKLQLKSLKNHPLLEARGEGLNRGLPTLSHEGALRVQQGLESVSTSVLIGASVRLQTVIGTGLSALSLVHTETKALFKVSEEEHGELLDKLCTELQISKVCACKEDGSTHTVIGYKSVGDGADRYREVLFKLFERTFQVRKTELKEAVMQDFGTSLLHRDYMYLTKTFCESIKPGVWKLKCLSHLTSPGA